MSVSMAFNVQLQREYRERHGGLPSLGRRSPDEATGPRRSMMELPGVPALKSPSFAVRDRGDKSHAKQSHLSPSDSLRAGSVAVLRSHSGTDNRTRSKSFTNVAPCRKISVVAELDDCFVDDNRDDGSVSPVTRRSLLSHGAMDLSRLVSKDRPASRGNDKVSGFGSFYSNWSSELGSTTRSSSPASKYDLDSSPYQSTWKGSFPSTPTAASSQSPSMPPKDRRQMQPMRDRVAEPQSVAPVPQKHIKSLGGKKIFDLYSWDKVLQESGDGGKVVVCRPKDRPGEAHNLVLKMQSKQTLRKKSHEEEYRNVQLRMLNIPPHDGVLQAKEVFEDDNFYYVVMDKASGGPFFECLLEEFEDGVMPERAICGLMHDILEAVGHLHANGVLHRDLKPDNMVMQKMDGTGARSKRVALIDFDHADVSWSPRNPSQRGCCYGSMRFNAPETFLGEYFGSSDLYSVGAIMYLLMTGKMPYPEDIFTRGEPKDKDPRDNKNYLNSVFQEVSATAVDWECDPWPTQPICRFFCQRLLAFDPADRFNSAQEALADPWFTS